MKNYLLTALLTWPLLVIWPKCSLADELPDMGDASQGALSPQQERQIGEQSMLQIRADNSYLDDTEIYSYLNQLGYQLVAHSADPAQEFEFFALNDTTINAFALPGGFIGVNSGLILTAESESELASVLSHEIAHVTQHHLARMVAGQKYDSAGAMAAIAVAILAARSNPDAAQVALIGAQAGSIQRQLNFTRTHEMEADRIGLTTLQKAEFDTRAMPLFFERLQKSTRLLDNSLPSYLRTHPITSERIADIASRVQQTPYRLVADNLNFQLVRAKLRATLTSTQEAIAYFTAALGAQKHGDQTAQRYGLALALLKNGQMDRAAIEFFPLNKLVTQNPMIATLAGKINQAQIRRADKKDAEKDDKHLTEFYRTATQNFPQYRALSYDYAELLLDNQRYADSLQLLNDQVADHPNDPRLYELQARAYGALGKPQEEHHALAYVYALHGNLSSAIEQLELAKLAGKDYYQLSIIESELKQFKEWLSPQQKK